MMVTHLNLAGHFGKVYKGMLTHASVKEPDIVAVKTLHGEKYFNKSFSLNFLYDIIK